MVQGPYPRVVRLIAYAVDRWDEIDAAYYNINPPLLRQPPWRLTSLIYAWLVQRIAYDKLAEWEAELDDLLPWQTSDSEAAAELESESFFSMMNRQG